MPGTLQLMQVGPTPIRIQSFMAPSDEVMLVNPDITNNIYIGNDPASQPIAVPALGSVTLDTQKHDLWVSTNGGGYVVNAYLMPNGSNWVPSPAQVAAQIEELGLATESNQNTQIAQGNTVANNTGTTAANTAGVAKDATLQTTNTNTANTAANTAGVAKDTTLGNVVNNTTGIAKDATVGSVVTNTTGVAKDSSLGVINTTLGVPSQRVDVQALTIGGTPGGIPVLRGTSQLGSGSARTLAGNGNAVLLNNIPINQPGFEGMLQLNLPAGAGTYPFATLTFFWTDSATGLQFGQKFFVLWSGNGPSNALQYYISGPCRGNLINLQLTNKDPNQTLTYTWAMNQTSHTHLVDRLMQVNYSASPPIGFTTGGGGPTAGLLFASQPTVGPNSSAIRWCAAYNGRIKVSVDNTVQPNSVAVAICTPANVSYYGDPYPPTTLMKITLGAGSQNTVDWCMPNGATYVQIFNQGTTGNTAASVAITMVDY